MTCVVFVGNLDYCHVGPPLKWAHALFCPQGFREILDGKWDHLPEVAFYMVGAIDEVAAKAETLAKDLP